MKRAAFTLVEMLVVISIMALLTALLIPCLQSSRSQARAVLCRSNLRQLTLSFLAYETEHGTLPPGIDSPNFTPPPDGYAGEASQDRMGWWWFDFMQNLDERHRADRTVIQCPSKQQSTYGLRKNVLCGNYGVNRSVCKDPPSDLFPRKGEFAGLPLRSIDVRHPNLTLLIVDSGYSVLTWWHATDQPPTPLGNTIEDLAYVPGLSMNKDRKLWPGQDYDAIYGRHTNRTVNVGYLDGGVASHKADDLFVESSAEGYRNQTPLWSPR